MCGVIGLIYGESRGDMGKVAGELLKTLEYRGYDSTGAAIQGEGPEVVLRKGVGAPSLMVHQLGIVDLAGQIFCGQVRWATFGAVNDLNSQPHVVRCKTFLYGAHNGNVTNCDELRDWLVSEGHEVLSDNDGEMVVHTVEHYFAIELAKTPEADHEDREVRRGAMRRAIIRAAAKLEGSYAAVVVDPIGRRLWAIKQGSSLYFGLGHDPVGGPFAIASSDLSSVLKLTRVVVSLSEGELVEFDPASYQLMAVRDRTVRTGEGVATFRAGELVERSPVRSRLRAKDTALLPPFETFMDQEISSQEETCRNVVTLFLGGSERSRELWPAFGALSDEELSRLRELLDQLRDEHADEAMGRRFHDLADAAELARVLSSLPPEVKGRLVDASPEAQTERLVSSEAGFFADLLPMCRDAGDQVVVRLLDAFLEKEEVDEYAEAVDRFTERCLSALGRGGRIYVVCCGTSYHAAKAASLFFNELARVQAHPVLPGEFRGEYAKSLRDGDLFIAVSQSGETKDLIDVMNDVIATGREIDRVAVVNNVNSTLAQEKSDLVIPLRCGPEIAVPATKSFINQLAVFYCLALRLAERRLPEMDLTGGERAALERDLERRRRKLPRLPELIRETFDSTDAMVEAAAQNLYLCPSMQLLATRITAVAKEGALKVREVVLNHAEGFEGSEFKHGPNTILGFNTIFGPAQVEALLKRLGFVLDRLAVRACELNLGPEAIERMILAVTDSVFTPRVKPFVLENGEAELIDEVMGEAGLVSELYADYPLVYITGPDPRDVALTVSQINTHKIRGAQTVVIAEDHPELRGAATKAPADNPRYRSVYITLPRTNDTLMVVFSSTVVLQRLALKMSERKAQYLDGLGIKDHGVHPDVPKNVSKSITVD